MKKQIFMATMVAFILLVSGVVYSCNYNKDKDYQKEVIIKEDMDQGQAKENKLSDSQEIKEEIVGPEILQEDIYVHICGAILKENVYKVKVGTRLVEVIDLAGGLLENAAGDFINQAIVVEDGARIYIPTKEELEEMEDQDYLKGEGNPDNSDHTSGGLVNINKASLGELTELPGIGEAKAQKIIDHREKNGDLENIEDIMNISGIKEGLFTQIEGHISVK